MHRSSLTRAFALCLFVVRSLRSVCFASLTLRRAIASITLGAFLMQVLGPTALMAAAADVVSPPSSGLGSRYDARLESVLWGDEACMPEEDGSVGLGMSAGASAAVDLGAGEAETVTASGAVSLDSGDNSEPLSLAQSLREQAASEADIVHTADGYTWSRLGYTYRFTASGDVYVGRDKAYGATGQAPSSVLTLCNPHGAVIVEEALALEEFLVQARGLAFTGGGVSTLGHLGATLYQLNGENGFLTVKEGSTLALGDAVLQGATVRNQGTLSLAEESVLRGEEGALINEGSLTGSGYTLDLISLTNQGLMEAQDATLCVDTLLNQGTLQGERLEVRAGDLTNAGLLSGSGTLSFTQGLNKGALVSTNGLRLEGSEHFRQEGLGALTGKMVTLEGKATKATLGGQLEIESLHVANAQTLVEATPGQSARMVALTVGEEAQKVVIGDGAALTASSIGDPRLRGIHLPQ